MKPILALVLTSFLSVPAVLSAQVAEQAADLTVEPVAEQVAEQTAEPTVEPETPVLIQSGEDVDLASFLWHKRPIVIFADSPEDPRFNTQIELLSSDAKMLLDRDVIVLTDTNPAAKSELRKNLRPRGFALVLVGKDGGVKLRKPHPWSVRELTRSIDKFPDRLREVEERREN
ncbi:DUF4174 domain-containing protein [Pseudophaeobacter leonis]|uniref:DUF4174 domain-containing protein n=1 Tax=Pseudophaeobacter leonis TaxID=1144477 RepID=UPI0009F4BEF3|nr:DUF4174 domain-containing protein [Pseudophaeobacter leonis]